MQPWIAVMLLTMSAGVASAQDPGKQGSKEAKSTPPAGSGATSASAEGGTARKTSAQETTTNEKKKPKKVWTNDEMSSVHGTVSVVGGTRSSPIGQEKKAQEQSAGNANDEARSKEIENYRSQIQELRSQFDAIDQRAAQLKSFRAENTSPSGGINLNHGYNMDPIEDQLKQLEARKKQLESKIADIEIAAEKKGIAPGDLR